MLVNIISKLIQNLNGFRVIQTGNMNFISRNLFPLRNHLVSDPTKSSLQGLIENVIRRTRLLFRGHYRKEGNGRTGFRQQHRLPETLEGFNYSSKFRGVTKQLHFFRPGFIQRATLRWSSSSLAATASRDARRNLFRGSSGPLVAFVGFTLAKKPSLLTEEEEPEGLTYEIRDSFSKLPLNVIHKHNTEHLNAKPETTFNDLQIGSLLAKGCNAAVYSACWKHETAGPKSECIVQIPGKMIISHSESEISANPANDSAFDNDSNKHSSIAVGALAPYDLAVKLMFNYNAESNAFAIWRAMYKETLPAILDFPLNDAMGFKKKREKNKLPPHPNIVEMYCAFADQVPLLPEAFTSYPQALPFRLTNEGFGRNMTLFLVMKRYHCCLKEYLKMHEPSTKTSLLILCQLLEGLVHLQQHEIVHRDLKTDNILIDLTYGVSNPGLAITDFGCCLEKLQLAYRTEEIDRGGNMALMAPEIATATAGPFATIDYSRSDLWTVGTMAYEIFGAANPFYLSTKHCLRTDTYDENVLPPLPSKVPAVIQKLIKDILNRDPNMRPSPTFAATVCQLLLHAPPELLVKPCKKSYKKVVDWLFIMAAQTFLQAVVQRSRSSSVEFQLRYSFCSRIQFCELLQALHYISQT